MKIESENFIFFFLRIKKIMEFICDKNKFFMLAILLMLPLLGILLILIFGSDNSQIKRIGLLTSILNLIVCLIIWGEFDSNIVGYQFVQEFNHLDFCHFNVGLDGISLYFVILTSFIIPISLLSTWDNIGDSIKSYVIIFLLLETLLIAVFVVLDILLFYIFFESVLPPLFYLIGI